jgi:hypothetical protein
VELVLHCVFTLRATINSETLEFDCLALIGSSAIHPFLNQAAKSLNKPPKNSDSGE